MSLSIAAAAMTMRATLKRSEGARDGYGDKATPQDWRVVSSGEPCFVWVPSHVQVADGAKVAAFEEIRSVWRASSGIQRGDRVEELRDRRDRSVVSGHLEVTAVSPRTMSGAQGHVMASLRRAV